MQEPIKKVGLKMKIDFDPRKKGVWSQKAESCQACKSMKKKHFAKGLCKECYYRHYRAAMREKREKNMALAKEMIQGQ